MDFVPHCPDAGFRSPAAAVARRASRRFDLALVAALCLAVGFLVGVAWTLAAVGAAP